MPVPTHEQTPALQNRSGRPPLPRDAWGIVSTSVKVMAVPTPAGACAAGWWRQVGEGAPVGAVRQHGPNRRCRVSKRK